MSIISILTNVMAFSMDNKTDDQREINIKVRQLGLFFLKYSNEITEYVLFRDAVEGFDELYTMVENFCNKFKQ